MEINRRDNWYEEKLETDFRKTLWNLEESLDYKRYFIVHKRDAFLAPRAILISFIHPWFIRLFRVASRMENFSCVATIKTFQRSKTLSDSSSYKSIPKES